MYYLFLPTISINIVQRSQGQFMLFTNKDNGIYYFTRYWVKIGNHFYKSDFSHISEVFNYLKRQNYF